MDAQKEIEVDARLYAVEMMAVVAYNMAVDLTRIDERSLAEAEKDAATDTGLLTSGITDPAMSDHISAERQAALERLQTVARRMRGRS